MAENESKSINLNIVCLRFDALKMIDGIYYPICEPVYSNPINNLKSALTGDLKIVRMDCCSSPSVGGREIFLLVEKVTKKNIKVRFFELDDEDNEIWSDYGLFNDLDVHHQYAIVLKTPPYKDRNIGKDVRVFVELQRPTDGARSEPKDFKYTPYEIVAGRKRRYIDSPYNSSNFSSGNLLPSTINDISENNFISDNDVQQMDIISQVDSHDLDNAVGDLDSGEFNKICSTMMTDSFQELFTKESISERDIKRLTLTMDGARLNNLKERPCIEISPNLQSNKPMKKLSQKDYLLIDRAKRELSAFIQTNGMSGISEMFEHVYQRYMSQSGNTILHLLLIENNVKSKLLFSLLHIMKTIKGTSLLSIRNKVGQTVLNLAVEQENTLAVSCLLQCKPDISEKSLKGNTALHIAVMKNNIDIVNLLLADITKVDAFINVLNNDGLTALHLAVKTNNLSLTKLLCGNHADVNIEDKKNGYTPLHMAVADQNPAIVNFLIENTNIKCEKEDFGQSNALKLAKVLTQDNKSISIEIYNKLEHFMKNKGTFEAVHIKEELDDLSDDEDFREIKMEPASPIENGDQIEFTTDCLNKVSKILNASGNWHSLAELLDYRHLLVTNIFKDVPNPTKILLDFAIASGDSVQQIRNFLENLDESNAVEIIDDMMERLRLERK